MGKKEDTTGQKGQGVIIGAIKDAELKFQAQIELINSQEHLIRELH